MAFCKSIALIQIITLWRKQRNHDLAEQKLGAGYLSLIKGDWKRAEAQLSSKAKHSGIPHVSYLAAAQAAQEQGKISERDRYIRLAYESAPDERLAIGMTKARLHQAAGQIDQTIATLKDVQAQGKGNAQYTAMLVQANQSVGDLDEVERLLPLAKKQKALSQDDFDSVELQVVAKSLMNAPDIEKAWKSVPRASRKKPELVGVYVLGLMEANKTSAAEKLIRSTLSNTWDDSLLELYGRLQHPNPGRILRRVEGWLLARPENGLLSLVAGKLALAADKTEQAKNYLQDAIARGGYAEAYELLGSVYEKGSESGKALELYRAGITRLAQPVARLDASAGEHQADEQTANEADVVDADASSSEEQPSSSDKS